MSKHEKPAPKLVKAAKSDEIKPVDIGARGTRDWSRVAPGGGPVRHTNGQADGTRRG